MEMIDSNLDIIRTAIRRTKNDQINAIYSNDYSKIKKWIENEKKMFKRKQISICKVLNFDDYDFLTSSVKSEINFICKMNKKLGNNFKQKLEMVFSEFDLNILNGNRKLKSLSNTERKKLYLILNTIEGNKCFIIKNLFKNVDKKSYRQYCEYFKYLINNGIKLILIDDINILYSISKYIIIVKDNRLLVEGETKEILNDVGRLMKNNLTPPYLSELTYLAKEKKGIKLFYQDDVRDVIKDVYKHVK